MNEMDYGLKKMNEMDCDLSWKMIIEVLIVNMSGKILSDYDMMCCKPTTKHLSLFQLTFKIIIAICLFVLFCFYFQANLLSSLFQTQLKTLINIFQHHSIYLLGFFKTHPDWVTFAPLGAIGFDGLMVVDEVTRFGELSVCCGATFSDNLVVVGILFWSTYVDVGSYPPSETMLYYVSLTKIRQGMK